MQAPFEVAQPLSATLPKSSHSGHSPLLCSFPKHCTASQAFRPLPGCFVPRHFPIPPAPPQSPVPDWLTPTHHLREGLPKPRPWLRCSLPGLAQDLSHYTAMVSSSQNPSHYNYKLSGETVWHSFSSLQLTQSWRMAEVMLHLPSSHVMKMKENQQVTGHREEGKAGTATTLETLSSEMTTRYVDTLCFVENVTTPISS